MKGNRLSPDTNVVRYIKPSKIDNGIVSGEEFAKTHDGPNADGVSVNCLDLCGVEGKDAQLARVKELRRIVWSANGRLAELSVGEVIDHVASEIETLFFVEDPLPAEENFVEDPSHSLIDGHPPDWETSLLIGDMIAECVLSLHPTQ